MNSAGKIGIAVVVAGLALGGGYVLLGASAEQRDLASGDSARVVDALTKLEKEDFGAEGNEELRTDALATLKNASVEDIFDRIRSQDLSDEERQRLESNLQQLMMEDMERKVDVYFNAAEEEQEALLDAHIDEMQKFMEEMRAYHEKHKDDPDYQAERDRRRERRQAPSTQERKQQMESRNPDQMVRMFQYWGKMRARAQERGIEFGPGRRNRNDDK